MTLVHSRDRMLRLAPMVEAVHAEGAAIWIQVGHGGLFAMEAWHEPYASRRAGPLLAPSPPRWWLGPVFRRAPVHEMTTDEVHALCCEEWGYDSVTPVEVSVFPDTTLSRGGIPSSIWRNRAIAERFRIAAPRALERRVIEAGYLAGGVTAPFRPVWNRSRFQAVKRLVSIPVMAVGGIRTAAEVNDIVDSGDADMVGIGRPAVASQPSASKEQQG